jgi:hypothetical protein
MLFCTRAVPPSAPRRRPRRLDVEPLEDRAVPALIFDPVGDILPSYAGGVLPGMDVVAHEVVLLAEQGRVVFHGKMAGPVADTADVHGLYLFGVDRGSGTPRFLSTPGPVIGPNVVWDSIVRVNPDGTGLFNNVVGGVITPLGPDNIHIDGNEFTVSVPLRLMLPASARPPEEWTYNLWPRDGIGNNAQVSDLAPDDGNVPFQVVAPARVGGVVINDGPAQRSMVNSLTVTFDGPVTLAPGAFALRRADGGLVDLSVAASSIGGRTVAVLQFVGPDIVGGSLPDGRYTLTVRADPVQDRFGRALDGDGDGAAGGDRDDAFHRLFGDSDGDQDVDLHDFGRFLDSFGRGAGDPAYLWYFDVNGDDRVGVVDLVSFARRLGKRR